MRFKTKLAVLTGTLALGLVPATALAQAPVDPGTVPENDGTAHKPDTPGPGATLPEKAKAYGKHCQDQSKKHVKGEKGTPFSRCVTAMAKLATGQTDNPRTACKTESKKHVKGEKGTPFSRCVVAGAKLLGDQATA